MSCSFCFLLDLDGSFLWGFWGSQESTSRAARVASMEIEFLGQVVGCAESGFWIGSLFCSADFLFGLLIFKLFLGLELDGMTEVDSGIGCSGF